MPVSGDMCVFGVQVMCVCVLARGCVCLCMYTYVCSVGVYMCMRRMCAYYDCMFYKL